MIIFNLMNKFIPTLIIVLVLIFISLAAIAYFLYDTKVVRDEILVDYAKEVENTAEEKGTVAGISYQMNNLRVGAELYFVEAGNSFEGFCDSAVALEVARNVSRGEFSCNDSGTTWAASTLLQNEPVTYLCVDGEGNSKMNSVGIGSSLSCI